MDRVIDNSRYEKLTFARPAESAAATMHGFAGYFDAKLYEGPAGCLFRTMSRPTSD